SNGNSAGGICVYGTLNMYGGIVAGNSSIRYGGGIFTSLGTVNLYDGIITHNTTGIDGAGVYVNGTVVSEVVQASGYLNMYGGIISYNRSSQYGGGIDFRTGGQGKIYGGEISHNWTFNDSGGILVWSYCKLEIFGGKITENEAHGANTGNSNCGAGILVGDNSTVIMNDGEITNNHMYSDINVLSTGGGIHVEGASQLILNGGVIAGNTAESTAGANGGGVYNDAGSYVYLGGGIKIYNNTANGRDSDLFLKNKVKLIIQKKLFTKEEMAHIGIDLATNYSDTTFTLDFGGSGNSLANATLLFFSNKANEVPTLKSGEVAFVSGTKATAYVTWSWQGDSSGSVNNKMTDIAVTYTGNPYTIKMQNNNFYKVGDAATASSFTAVLAGKYTFYTKENYLNPVFTFTILPKEVDIVWQHTDLIYNGVLQKPTAYIAEDSNCNVITIGEKINSGSGYVATAISLSNSN
ncbi:MAG: hypothetical protein K2L47_01415, partial [Clostridia bacterium]|nr:hypothetical protein [Clostridia bacterium]